MDAARYELVTRLFQEVCDLPPERRIAVLDERCDDAELRRAVEDLVAEDGSAAGFLEPSAVASASPEEPATLRRVGRYAVVEELGRGGMGVVLRALQETPKRDVALKLIKPELFGRGIAGRLEQEAEILGRLRHPGIAQIFEAGHAEVVDDRGRSEERPFIAMELVEGTPLEVHARNQGLSIRERVALLAVLCDALQHAHQRGVIHLDLKPANILVDENGAPRVLDFGVARALDRGVEARLAEGGSIIGTLAYMPPEQLTGHTHDLDTRADIYALGALGFELLTGQLPRRAPTAGFGGTPLAADAQQAARDALLAALTAPTPAAQEVDARIDAELSAVLARAMAPDRERRYASIGQFGADLRRWLAHEPVDARSGGPLRRARLYARRNRPVVIAASITVLIAVAALGLLVASMLNAHASAEREREATQAALLATAEAEAEILRAGRMSTFLQNAIFGVDPEELGPDASFFDALEYASNRIHRDLADAPLVEAEVRYSIGFIYRRHSMYAPARRNIQAALRTWREHLGEDHPKSISAAEEIAYLTLLVDGQAEAAAEGFRRILQLQQAAGRDESAEAGWQWLKLGRSLLMHDRLHESRDALDRASDLLARHYGEAYRARAMAWRALAELAGGDASEAEATARAALQLVDGASEQSYAEAHVRTVLARVLVEADRFDEAEEHAHAARRILEARLPENHVDLADVHEVEARLALAAGRIEAASTHADACHRIRSSRLGPDHPDLIAASALRTMAVVAPQNPSDAMHAIDELFRSAEQLAGSDHRLSLELIRYAIACAESAGDAAAAFNKGRVLQSLGERRAARLLASQEPAVR
ncbi:MAG: protein kinase [Planctomycetota bacterium]